MSNGMIIVVGVTPEIEEHLKSAKRMLRKEFGVPNVISLIHENFSDDFEECKSYITSCDLLILLVGHLYGKVLKFTQKSVTETAYDIAIERGVELFIFLAKGDVTLLADQVNDDGNWARQIIFRDRIASEQIASEFTSSLDVVNLLVSHLKRWPRPSASDEFGNVEELAGKDIDYGTTIYTAFKNFAMSDNVMDGLFQRDENIVAPPSGEILQEIPEDSFISENVASVSVFISYAHADADELKALCRALANLRRQKIIKILYDEEIHGGQRWKDKIDEQINSARIIILLISQSFIDSDYCMDTEVPIAMARYDAGKAIVVPIIIEPADYKGLPFEEIQFLPKDVKPINTCENQAEAWHKVSSALRNIVSQVNRMA